MTAMRRAAIPIALLVALAAILLIGRMAAGEGPGPLRPFYAEVAVEVEPRPDDPLADLRGPSRSVIRWWYAPDPNRWRWEIETIAPSLDAGTATTMFDGDEMWQLDASASYQHGPGPREVVMPPTFNAPVGPANLASMDAFVEHWRGISDTVEVTGEATILGRSTKIVEMRPAWQSASSAATAESGTDASEAPSTPTSSETSGGVIRAYVDPERMFIMRWEVEGEGEGQSYRADVTRLDYDVEVDEARFVFDPPPEAMERTTDDASCTSSSGLQDAGTISVPPGFLRPAEMPEGFRATSAGSESAPGGCGAVAAWALLEDDAGARIFLRQRLRADGIPAALRTGDPIEVGDSEAYRARNGGNESLVWSEGDVVALLEGDGVPFEALYRLATSAEVVEPIAEAAGSGGIQSRRLDEIRSQHEFPVFVPTYVPAELTPHVVGRSSSSSSSVHIEYIDSDALDQLTVTSCPFRCAPFSGGEPVVLRDEVTAYFVEGELYLDPARASRGAALWWEQDGAYVIVSSREFGKDELARIAASMSSTAELGDAFGGGS